MGASAGAGAQAPTGARRVGSRLGEVLVRRLWNGKGGFTDLKGIAAASQGLTNRALFHKW